MSTDTLATAEFWVERFESDVSRLRHAIACIRMNRPKGDTADMHRVRFQAEWALHAMWDCEQAVASAENVRSSILNAER